MACVDVLESHAPARAVPVRRSVPVREAAMNWIREQAEALLRAAWLDGFVQGALLAVILCLILLRRNE